MPKKKRQRFESKAEREARKGEELHRLPIATELPPAPEPSEVDSGPRFESSARGRRRS